MLRMYLMINLAFIFFAWPGYGIELETEEFECTSAKKYNLSICTIFKNESPRLKEWIEYHRHFGVDHFYLYNTGSWDSFYSVLRPYIDEGLVTLVNWPEVVDKNSTDIHMWELSTQVPAYENAVNFMARDETKWLAFVDINEFLVCPRGSVRELLQEYEGCAAISFPSDFIDKPKRVVWPKKNLSHDILEGTRGEVPAADRLVEKMIFKPDQCAGFNWPPYRCFFVAPQITVDVDRKDLKINHYCRERKWTSVLDKKGSHKHSADCHLLSEEEQLELFGHEVEIDNQSRPVFEIMPEFIKKRLRKQ